MTKQCSSCGGFCGNVCQRENVAQPKEQEPDKYLMDIECTKCGAKQSGVLTVNTIPPQRKPLTREQDDAICEGNCNAEAEAFFLGRPALDTAANRRIFYAGHRRAWLSKDSLIEASHGIKE